MALWDRCFGGASFSQESIAKRAKEELNVKYILDIREFPDLPYCDRFTKDFDRIFE